MASKEIIIKAGDPVAPELRVLLGEELSRKAIRLTIISPFPKVEKEAKPKVEIDETFVSKLKSLALEPEQLEREVNELSKPQLLRIAEIIGLPMSKGARVESLKAQLEQSLRSTEIWKAISGETGDA